MKRFPAVATIAEFPQQLNPALSSTPCVFQNSVVFVAAEIGSLRHTEGMKVGYARVSTEKQDTALQAEALKGRRGRAGLRGE